jgi:hypothetical protein
MLLALHVIAVWESGTALAMLARMYQCRPFTLLLQAKAFPAHCPTRFGVIVEIAQSVLENQSAIRAACHDDAWDDICDVSTSAATFHDIAVGSAASRFWKLLAAVVQLLQPVRDAIHQLEADQGMLSQVLPVWRDLVTHFRQWETQQTDEGLKADQVVKLLKARQKKSVHDAALLAYALDTLFFKQADSN